MLSFFKKLFSLKSKDIESPKTRPMNEESHLRDNVQLPEPILVPRSFLQPRTDKKQNTTSISLYTGNPFKNQNDIQAQIIKPYWEKQ